MSMQSLTTSVDLFRNIFLFFINASYEIPIYLTAGSSGVWDAVWSLMRFSGTTQHELRRIIKQKPDVHFLQLGWPNLS